MRKFWIIALFFSSCYTKTKKPDYAFMELIKQQAAIDSGKRTIIEITPRKYYFGSRKKSEKLQGFFYIKNKGKMNFRILAIRPDCDCIITDFQTKNIAPNDSLKINYVVDISNRLGFISNSIVAIGNCQFGNQTFYMEGTIINQ